MNNRAYGGGAGGGGGDFAGLNGENAEKCVQLYVTVRICYYRPAGGGGGVTRHMTGYAPIKKTHIARVCRVGGGGTPPNFCNITTGEGELETLGYVTRSQILISTTGVNPLEILFIWGGGGGMVHSSNNGAPPPPTINRIHSRIHASHHLVVTMTSS